MLIESGQIFTLGVDLDKASLESDYKWNIFLNVNRNTVKILEKC